MKKENIEKDYDITLDTKFIEKVGSPFDCDFPILGTNKFVKPIKDKKILVIRLESCAELYALNNSVTYVTDNKAKYDKFLEKVNDEKYGSDDSAILFNDWKNIDKLLEENNMKFDVCIMNPPYDKSLHLQILAKALNYADEVVNISPIRWLQDPLAKYKKFSDYNKYKVSICDKMTSLEILDSLHANSLFEQAFNMNIAISTYNVKCNKRFDYVKFNSNDLLDKLISKSTDFIANHAKTSIMCNWTIVLSLMIGGSNGRLGKQKYWNDDYDRTVYHNNVRADGKTYKEYRQSVCWGNVKPKESAYHVEFNTELEVRNFYNYLHTKVFTYIFKVTQVDIHPHSDFYPFMNDYTQPWTDKRLCGFFNITGYISDTEAEPGSEWEIVLNTMSK